MTVQSPVHISKYSGTEQKMLCTTDKLKNLTLIDFDRQYSLEINADIFMLNGNMLSLIFADLVSRNFG